FPGLGGKVNPMLTKRLFFGGGGGAGHDNNGQATDGTLKGTYLAQVNCFPHFWFAWSATHPDTIIYRQTAS
ncbi:MAG: hypothetical protein ACPG7F_18455, partial [Aggregatilineales bacterium]